MGGDGAPVLSAKEKSTGIRMVAADGTELSNTDLTAARNEWLFKPPPPLRGWLESTLENQRDAPMVYLIFNITFTIIPSAFALYRFPDLPGWVGPLHVLTIVRRPPRSRPAAARLPSSPAVLPPSQYALFLQRFILCLHYSEHRKIFKKKYNLLNSYLAYVVAPFMGLPTGMYNLHHVVMHHRENNVMPWDLSSTEPYQVRSPPPRPRPAAGPR